jgi:hypothetical protein
MAKMHSIKAPNICLHLPSLATLPFLKDVKSNFNPSLSIYYPANTQSNTNERPQNSPIATWLIQAKPVTHPVTEIAGNIMSRR